MNFDQLIRITVILIAVAGLDILAYIVALKLTEYYRRGIASAQKRHKDALQAEEEQASAKAPARQWRRAVPRVTEPIQPLLFTIPPPPNAGVPSNVEPATSLAVCPQKFSMGNRVEFFNSRGELTGNVISCNANNSKCEYRYLVNWGKDGIWWVAEDQIETAEPKHVEVNV